MKNVLHTEGADLSLAGGSTQMPPHTLPQDSQSASDSGFEMLIAELSGRLESQSEPELSETVIRSLQVIADHIGADRVSLIEFAGDDGIGAVIHSQCSPKTNLRPLDSAVCIEWLCGELRQGRAHVFTAPDYLPRSASVDRSFFRTAGIENCLAVPLGQPDSPDFALLCETRRQWAGWAIETLNRVTLVGRMIVNAVRRSRADRAIVELKGRLVDAQECERRRIARELHDDVSQRMAHLCLDLIRLKDEYEKGACDIGEVADDLANRTRLLSSDIGRICRDLYPSRLAQADLVSAVRGLCRDFDNRHRLDVEFQDRLKGKAISDEIAFCLFRIAQEALRNVVKHSGARSAVVELCSRGEGIEMVITDTGNGFDLAVTTSGDGLGLNSMRDRLQLLGGQLLIETSPNLGTRIEIRVPAAASAHP